LGRTVNVDQGWFAEERIEGRIRTTFFQDGPRQRGDTPPTAAQWLDERRRVQQRLGKPSAPLWSELLYPMIQRVEYLAVEIGRLPDAITHNGQVITVTPISPLQKAQNHDKVMTTRSNLDLAAALLADQLPQYVDVIGTLKAVAKFSDDELLKIHAEPQQEAPVAPPQAA
ncbi:MAG: portal protein, partial [Paracoccaceae bacterium]